jgi:hypothetical protein
MKQPPLTTFSHHAFLFQPTFTLRYCPQITYAFQICHAFASPQPTATTLPCFGANQVARFRSRRASLTSKMPSSLSVAQSQHMTSYKPSFKLRSLYQLLMLVMYQSATQLNQSLQQTSSCQCGYLLTGNKYTRFFASRLNGNQRYRGLRSVVQTGRGMCFRWQ